MCGMVLEISWKMLEVQSCSKLGKFFLLPEKRKIAQMVNFAEICIG